MLCGVSGVIKGSVNRAVKLTSYVREAAANVLPAAVTDRAGQVALFISQKFDSRSLSTGGSFVVQHLVTNSLRGSYLGIPALVAGVATAWGISETIQGFKEAGEYELIDVGNLSRGEVLPFFINAPSIWIPDGYLAGAATLLSAATFRTHGPDGLLWPSCVVPAALYGSYFLGGPVASLGASLLVYPLISFLREPSKEKVE